MDAQAEAARRGAGPLSPDGTSPPWAAPARLAPLHPRCHPTPAWPTASLVARRPLALAAAALLAGGVVAGSLGATPARAAFAPATAAPAPAAAAARGALLGLRLASAAPASDSGLLARLLAAPTADDALLSSLLATAPAGGAARLAPVAFPAFELAAEPAAAPAAPASVSFATVAGLPSTAFSYAPAAVGLPAITLADQRAPVPPPAPPAAPGSQGRQPPPPPGYVQPPGYQDGVPFGGQIGAVPGSTPGRPAGGASPSPRPVVASNYTVRAGDTLSTIALRYYGNARYAGTIWEANYRLIGANPNLIVPGQRLVLPGIGTRPAVTAPLPARGPIGQRAYYTIQPRDFLRWIAQRAYGTEVFWPEIYHSNRNVLGPNPDLIYPGVRVYIP